MIKNVGGRKLITMSSLLNQKSIITVDDNTCIGCNACVRACPVKAISTKLKEGTKDEFVASVISQRCIQCGECVKVCEHNARGYIDDSEEFFKNLNDTPMHIIVAPSIQTAFKNWKSVLKWLQKLGHKIYDVSYGADICTWAHLQSISDGTQSKIISQPCPAIVSYIEKYQPDLIDSLSKVHSPASCLAVYLKTYQNIKEKIYLLSPCIAKKVEAEKYHTFDYNVTYNNLKKYISSHDIVFYSDDFEFDMIPGVLGKLYPRPGGLKDNLLAHNPNLVIRTAEGISAYERIKRYSSVDVTNRPDVLDCLNCRFGCCEGTASTGNDLTFIESTMDKIETDANADRGHFIFKDRIIKDFNKKLKYSDFYTSYNKETIEESTFTEEEIDAQFNKMLKTTPESRKIDCHACGYSSCTQMCEAILEKHNVKENCVYYMKNQLKADLKENEKLQEKLKTDFQKNSQDLNSLIEKFNKLDSDQNFGESGNTAKNLEYINKLISVLNSYKEEIKTNMPSDSNELSSMLDQILLILESIQTSLNNSHNNEIAFTDKWKEIKEIIDKANKSK